MITVKVEQSPILPGNPEIITFTMCDHSELEPIDPINLLLGMINGQMPDMSKLTCTPYGVPMDHNMVEFLADTIEENLARVSPTTSLEAWIVRQSDMPPTEQPGVRILLGLAFGLKLSFWEFTPENPDSPATEPEVTGQIDWDRVPELLASMREELAVYRSKHPEQGDDGEPDMGVGANA